MLRVTLVAFPHAGGKRGKANEKNFIRAVGNVTALQRGFCDYYRPARQTILLVVA